MLTRPTLRPMHEFDPSKPAVLHDTRSDEMIAWTAEREQEFRSDAAWYGDGLVAWDGAPFDGWVEALGG
jgi:hypothetical protein